MKLPLSIATKIRQLLLDTNSFPASVMKHNTVNKMLEDGVLLKKIIGKSQAVIFLQSPAAVHAYLQNQFGIKNLDNYIEKLSNEELSRSEAVEIAANSKIRAIRSFKGFLVNCYAPVKAVLNGAEILIEPLPGRCLFISDFTCFIPDPAVTIVGIENPENFMQVQQQAYLFGNILPLFICRYPQNHDTIKWLQTIPNSYLHFGDLDFEGIKIYLHEYKKHLQHRAGYFIPPHTESLLPQYGNRTLYNKQLPFSKTLQTVDDPSIQLLLQLFHLHKKVLEQEIFIENLFSR